jgi:hypothetical protein
MGSLEFANLSPASRHAPARRPAMRSIRVHGVDRRAHLFICQGEEPSDAAFQPFRQMQPQRLDQHLVGEVLRDQKASRLTTPVPRDSDS